MKNKIIVIASVLKPLDDPRHYERFALSLAKTNKYEINIIANGEKKQNEPHINFHSNGFFGKGILHRLKLQLQSVRSIYRLRPQLIIVCSLDLLPWVYLYRIIRKCKVVYDVQENYQLNVCHLADYNWSAKWRIPFIRFVESLSAKFVDHFFLAEKCYKNQLKFITKNHTVLENKTVPIQSKSRRNPIDKNKAIKLLFSGTISHYSGIEIIYQIIQQLNEQNVDYSLTIIGQVHDIKVFEKLQRLNDNRIKMIIDQKPINHQKIIAEIRHADLGLITYQPNVVNKWKVPTKLYEYTTYQLPYLIREDSHWSDVGERLGGAIPVNFHQINFKKILSKLRNPSFMHNSSPQKDSLWMTEEAAFQSIINSLLI